MFIEDTLPRSNYMSLNISGKDAPDTIFSIAGRAISIDEASSSRQSWAYMSVLSNIPSSNPSAMLTYLFSKAFNSI